jgi:hypothetical protein
MRATDHHAFVEALAGARWHEAWQLAEGDVMDGFTLPRAPEFESWLEFERAAVRAGKRTAGTKLARAAMAAGDHEQAVAVLSVLHDVDEFDEEVLRDLMSALATRGSRGEALAVYGRFERRCVAELGGSPAAPLVGRTAELRVLEQRLADPSCRLLALVGPGGNGKTRLAIELARREASRAHRDVAYVDLVARPSSSTTAASVARCSSCSTTSSTSPMQPSSWPASSRPRPA